VFGGQQSERVVELNLKHSLLRRIGGSARFSKARANPLVATTA
jgi:hypothetical protein